MPNGASMMTHFKGDPYSSIPRLFTCPSVTAIIDRPSANKPVTASAVAM
jgi:hypothetical protein